MFSSNKNNFFKKLSGVLIGVFFVVALVFPSIQVLAAGYGQIDPASPVGPYPDAGLQYIGSITAAAGTPGLATADAGLRAAAVADAQDKVRKDSQEWWFRRAEYLKQQWGMRVATALFGGLIDAMSMISQRIAYEAASDLLYGNPGNEPRFWSDPFGSWLENQADDLSSQFIDRLDVIVGDWTQQTTGGVVRFSFCTPPEPLALKLSFGIGEAGRLGRRACGYKQVVQNFEAVKDMVESREALQIHRPSVAYGSSDLSVGVEMNSAYFNKMIQGNADSILERKENAGWRAVTDAVSGKINIPTALAEDSYKQLAPLKMTAQTESQQQAAILGNYFLVGLENIPLLALNTFTNTLIVGLLHKWLDPAGNGIIGDSVATPEEIRLQFDALKNADASGDAQDLYQRKEFAKALGDYLIPNFSSSEDLDIITELTTCNTPRKRFNCAMDQALGVAIAVGTKDGALTVGRAAGMGSEGATFSPASQALHADWEMIPENDIKNNTDPTCAQRAYCAGNLKKMRLSRIIPVGWEMAANSPYNIKKSGRYITLGEVIRGFYDCNNEGKLDKDHPWCHLIDPNWILTAPKYQCRAKGFGDAILPEIGSRLEECGDMVSCLSTSQTGECTGGYGYCLAERPVWKFDSRECDAQYVSCRTYSYSGGQISLLRNTVDRGKCSEENVGCYWYATERYVHDAQTPDGLWVGTATSGPRLYMDGGVESCSAEGCTKVLQTKFGESALNLIANSSFEQVVTTENAGVTQFLYYEGWEAESISQCMGTPELNTEAHSGSYSTGLSGSGFNNCVVQTQNIDVSVGRNYILSFYYKAQTGSTLPTFPVRASFLKQNANLEYIPTGANVTTYEGCTWDNNSKSLLFSALTKDSEWHRMTCSFIAPTDAQKFYVSFEMNSNIYFDDAQLEEGEVVTPFIDGLATGLKQMYLKIAPDEYACTGNDDTDNPACQRFARVCRQIDVGCQGYRDVENLAAPEVPAILSSKDLCPAICAGYGEYRKLASSFDLIKNPADPEFDDPQDETVAYFVPAYADKCSYQDVGCEPFTSMEAVTSTGEAVSYYKDIRLCEKPNEYSATYFTWEGSDINGYQLRTWSLISSVTDPALISSSPPKTLRRATLLGYIKDPDNCNAAAWNAGTDPDCRQFYDAAGNAYYIYYSQTISSDGSCTEYRKDDSTLADCEKTGGYEFVAASKSCTYHALPSESMSCPALAGGCRAYLGPTGRNAVNVFQDTFATGTTVAFEPQTGASLIMRYSDESVLVGDRSLRLEAPAGQNIDVILKLGLSNVDSLMRVSFWAKTNHAKSLTDSPSIIRVDGKEIGTFYPDINWARFEFGPFLPSNNPMQVEIVAPSNIVQDNVLFIDTFSVDELQDVQFVRKNRWAVPLACDATTEGVPEPRAMVGCREYQDRDSNTVFARGFSSLCKEQAIGCKSFIDTNSETYTYPKTFNIKGTALPTDFNSPNYRKTLDAKNYEAQFYGDWSFTSRGYRYYYAIDDTRGRCDSSEDSCRAYGKPIFEQNRQKLASTTYDINPLDEAIYQKQKMAYKFETVLLKQNLDKLIDENGEPNLACRKDELFCDRFQSGNVTDYFRSPGDQTCTWQKVKRLTKNDAYNIPADGDYSGWFRDGTDIPCYPPYLASGNEYLIQYSGEDAYAGWGGTCPVDQSECTEFIDPNDTSDAARPDGRPYYMINGPRLDKRSCGGVADPLSGCVLFHDTSVGTLEANSQATYEKVMSERGAPQTPIDCAGDPGNEYCAKVGAGKCESSDTNINGQSCQSDSDCGNGLCKINDSNVVIKVKMDRECARWMGCKTGETVYDPTQQKYVTQCNEFQICQKNNSVNEDIYCSEFTNRDKENYLYEGQFVTPESYSARKIGFGVMDYSGYIAPFHYLLPDSETRSVGFDLLQSTNSQLADKYKYDKRLVSAIPEEMTKIDNNRCEDTRTGRIGYIVDEKCILPISESLSFLQSGQGQVQNTNLNADEILDELNRGINSKNTKFQISLPMPECQLYPEDNSPLSTYFVQSWNMDTNPPTPKEMVPGYASAKTCVYGEDCSCSYRKARYSDGTELYYGLYGASPTVGICKGGTKAGQPCVNRQFVPNAGGKVLYSLDVLGDFEPCGPGGTCEEFQDLVFVNGKYAYCFERDLTRTIDAPQPLAPCLTWAPINTIGRYNPAHNAVTAGYLPPQGRGEYFCVAGTQNQVISDFDHNTKSFNQSLLVNEGVDFQAPGNTTNFGCSYQNIMTQGDPSKKSSYLNGSSNYGVEKSFTDSPGQVKMKDACRRAMVCQGLQSKSICSKDEGLWIQTGPDHEKTYSEYFIPYRPALEKFQDENFFDYRYGLFRFFMVKAPDGSACKWNPLWVGESHVPMTSEDFSCTSYLQQTLEKSNKIYDAFKQEFSGILDRRSEDLLRDSSNTPFRLRCLFDEANSGNGCYYKFWEINYKVQSEDRRFSYPKDVYEDQIVKTNPSLDQGFFNPDNVNNGRCDSDHPYFSIRAMFQDVSLEENALSGDMVESRAMNGPWQFIGFWVSACIPYQFTGSTGSYTGTDNALMYLKLQTVKVDICKVVAQTQEPQTKESITFADRVWASGAFVVPYIGAKYGRINEPFGSAVAAADIGNDPMVMGDSVPASSDPRKAPTFPDAGKGLAADFVGTDMDPWFSLTNLFARIYKVYKWDTNQIYPNTPVCVDWPDKAGTEVGTRPVCMYLNNGSLTKDQALENIRMCSGWDSATEVTDQDDLAQLWECNALSGVNRGLSCGRDPSKDKNTDALCHNAPVMYYSYQDSNIGTLTLEKPLYGSCVAKKSGNDPYIALQKYNIFGEGVKFSFNNPKIKANCAAGAIQKNEVLNMIKPDNNLFVNDIGSASKIDKSMGKSEWSLGGLPYYYQEYVLTPENIQKMVSFLIQQSYYTVDHDRDIAFVKCQPNTLQFPAHVYEPMKSGGSDTVDVSVRLVAKKLLEYIKEARAANVTIVSYASRQYTDPTAPNYDKVLGAEQSLEARIAKQIALFIPSHIESGGSYAGLFLETNGYIAVSGDIVDPDTIVWSKSTEVLLEAIVSNAGQESFYDGALLIPDTVNFGPYDMDSITGKTGSNSQDAQTYVCGSDSVEPGLRCRPNYSDSLGVDTYSSVDCPKVIKPSTRTTLNASTIGEILEIKDHTFTANEQGATNLSVPQKVNIPKQGFCFKGLGTGTGQIDMTQLAFYNWIYHTDQPAGSITLTYADDDYAELMPGTGYCLGFNKASRCRSNADCTFNTNQWWGMNDEGGAANQSYYAGLKELKIFSERPDNVDDVSNNIRVSLPTPYKYNSATNLTIEQIADKYKMEINTPPLLINNVLKFWLYLRPVPGEVGKVDYEGSGDFHSEYKSRNYVGLNCPTNDVYNICSYFQQIVNFYTTVESYMYDGGYFEGAGGATTATDYVTAAHHVVMDLLSFLLRTNFYQIPSAYARNFTEIVDQAYIHNNQSTMFERRVTMAPFVVNFWSRFIRSLGFAGVSNIYHDDDDEGVTDGVWDGHGEIDDFDVEPYNGSNQVHAMYNKGTLYNAQTTLELTTGNAHYLPGNFTSNEANSLGEPTDKNAVFPWEQMNFTNVFSAVMENTVCYDSGITPLHREIRLVNGTGVADGIKYLTDYYFGELFDVCEYFGFESNYRDALKKDANKRIDLYTGGSNTSEIAFNNLRLADAEAKSMQYGFYNKVGWGLVMKPNHDAFNLYPGVIPAGIGSEGDEKYNLYLPAHCEPAVGAIDSVSKFDGFTVNEDLPFAKSKDTWSDANDWQTRKLLDKFWFGPRFLSRWHDHTMSKGNLFLMPWEDEVWKTIPSSQVSEEHGMPIDPAMTTLFGATYNLDGQPEAFTESDFKGVTNFESIGSLRTAYICERTGQKVKFKEECNQDLIDKGWNYEDYANAANPQDMTIGSNNILVSALCDITKNIPECQMDPGTYLPPSYIETCSDLPGASVDQDCDSCTHSPGFMPLVIKPMSYQLGNPYSTNYKSSNGIQQSKLYPSATDVTSGLDTFEYMTNYSNTYQKGELIAMYQPIPPRLAAPDAFRLADSANAQPVYYLDTFSVNNNIQGVAYLGAERGLATVRFYAWAAHDQLPLRKILIDWGDGETTIIDDAKLKNRKPICNTDRECSAVPGLACTNDSDCPPGAGSCLLAGRCENTDKFCYKTNSDQGNCGGINQCKTRVLFGNSSEACQQGYFEFTHVYETKLGLNYCGNTPRCQYEPDKLTGQCRPGEGVNDRLAPKGGCYDGTLKMVRYTPRVMVVDNWNWCTGNCKQSVEPTPYNYNNASRYPIRHPNLGCWDGSSVRYNTDSSAAQSPYPNECDVNNTTGRPWSVFQGSVEISILNDFELQNCLANCEINYKQCIAQNKPNCDIASSVCKNQCNNIGPM